MVQDKGFDTIAAIATCVGESGIGIVRLSGKEALEIADEIFVSKDKRSPCDFKTYTTHYGWITENSRIKPEAFIDEVILTVMRSPRSYTKEDVVEINCHGGIVALRRVLELVLEKGCRLAEPGEFTRRAFLNGRIDLAQAESVLDIIRAKNDAALKVGTEQLKGALSSEINRIREILLDVLTAIESDIDFPEEGIDAAGLKSAPLKLKHVHAQLKRLLQGARCGRILREGIQTVICGKPNVGKSSLLNALLKQERSIVTSVPGTTRDTIEEIIDIRGIPVCIVDTAGIIEPRDLVEEKAVLRSRKYMQTADLILLVFDGSRHLTQDDTSLMKKLKKRNVIAVINKMDLKQRIERPKVTKRFRQVIDLSAKKLKNMNLLEEKIAHLVYQGGINRFEPVTISHVRHIEALKRTEKLIAQAVYSLDNKLSLEFIAQDIKEALATLDVILGKSFSEDLLDKIFSEFCIGK
ncbi:MAG: hypothetical protein AMJ95_01020 [Omnitrophica WOR_2 bacterium SM23_72]|nr:MAG: hypothetical protein AMJ95_01020 [Omnitrophica WOR_2 bacterium SM23_72]